MRHMIPRTIKFEPWMWERLCMLAEANERKPAAEARLIIKQALERRKIESSSPPHGQTERRLTHLPPPPPEGGWNASKAKMSMVR